MRTSRNKLVQAHNARMEDRRVATQAQQPVDNKDKVKHVALGAVMGAVAVVVAPTVADMAMHVLLDMEQDLIRENVTNTFYNKPLR